MTGPDLSTLSGRVEYARELRGLSRRELSLKAGLAQALVGQIERNENADPHASTITALAKALDVDAAWLLTGVGEMPVDQTRNGTEG